MNPTYFFALTLLLPFTWLITYGTLLVARIRVGEGVAVAGGKLLVSLMLVGYAVMWWQGEMRGSIEHWVFIPGFYEFPLEFHFTRALGAAALCMLMLLAVIVKYAESYIHKEPGFHRFFLLLTVFTSAFPVVLFADNIDVLFIGWELIGVTSFLLIGFYERRVHAARNAWWALVSYRFCDIGLLAATTLAHYAVHTTNIAELNDPLALMHHHPAHAATVAVIAGCMVLASLGKAAQLPFVSWITRAMEGPTPSSALYYGALSIGLGPLLLLKFQGLILAFPWVRATVIVIGSLSALYAYAVAKTRSDAKSVLALSAVFEVSLMVVEVGLGFYHLVIFHFIAHSFLRVFQFLRSMNAIHDFYDNPLFYRGAPHHRTTGPLGLLPKSWRKKSYYWALNGFGLDWVILNAVVSPWLALWKKLNRLENKIALGQQPGEGR